MEDDIIEADEFQPLTEREEIDLQKVISGCDFAISNAEVFMEQLGKDLSILDGVCSKYLKSIYIIMHI